MQNVSARLHRAPSETKTAICYFLRNGDIGKVEMEQLRNAEHHEKYESPSQPVISRSRLVKKSPIRVQATVTDAKVTKAATNGAAMYSGAKRNFADFQLY